MNKKIKILVIITLTAFSNILLFTNQFIEIAEKFIPRDQYNTQIDYGILPEEFKNIPDNDEKTKLDYINELLNGKYQNSCFLLSKLGDIYYYKGKFNEALIFYNQQITEGTSYGENKEIINNLSNINIAYILSCINKSKEALNTINILIENIETMECIPKFYSRAYFVKADILYKTREYDDCIDSFEKGFELDPREAYAIDYMKYSRIFYNKGDYNKAIEIINKAENYYPNDADIFLNRALAYYNLKNYKMALEDFNLTMLCIKKTKEKEQYINDIKSFIVILKNEKMSENEKVLVDLYMQSLNETDNEKIILINKKIIELNENAFLPYIYIAETEINSGNYNLAVEYLLFALKKKPCFSLIYYDLASIYYLKKDTVSFKKYADLCIKLDTSNIWTKKINEYNNDIAETDKTDEKNKADLNNKNDSEIKNENIQDNL